MWMEVVTRPLPFSGPFGPAEWIALGVTLVVLGAAFVGPTLAVRRAARSGEASGSHRAKAA